MNLRVASGRYIIYSAESSRCELLMYRDAGDRVQEWKQEGRKRDWQVVETATMI
jgi:hypothetical protein